MWDCAANETEREAIRTAMFGSVMDVVDRFLPDRSKHAPVRSMLAFLAVNSTFRGPYSPGSALCLAFALASPGTATMSKVRGGLGTIADHLSALFERHGGELRRHVKVSRILVEDGAAKGVEFGDGEVATAPVVVSNLDPTATFTHLIDADTLPEAFARRVAAIDHRAAYFQAHFALNGLPEYRGAVRGAERRSVRAQRDLLRHGRADAARLRGVCPGRGATVALLQPADPDARRPQPRPGRHARGEQLRVLPARRGRP